MLLWEYSMRHQQRSEHQKKCHEAPSSCFASVERSLALLLLLLMLLQQLMLVLQAMMKKKMMVAMAMLIMRTDVISRVMIARLMHFHLMAVLEI